MRLLTLLACVAAVAGALRPRELDPEPHAHDGLQRRGALGPRTAAASASAAARAVSAAPRLSENVPMAVADPAESQTASPTAASQPLADDVVTPPASSAWLIGVLAAALALSETILCLVLIRRLQTDAAWASVRDDLASFARAACCCACCCGGAKVVARPDKSLAAARERARTQMPPMPLFAETPIEQHVAALV